MYIWSLRLRIQFGHSRSLGTQFEQSFCPYDVVVATATTVDSLLRASAQKAIGETLGRQKADRKIQKHMAYEGVDCALTPASDQINPIIFKSSTRFRQHQEQAPAISNTSTVNDRGYGAWTASAIPRDRGIVYGRCDLPSLKRLGSSRRC